MFKRIFRHDDAHEFKPVMAEIEEKPANPLGRIIFWIIIASFVFFGLWTCIGRVDIVVTARGSVIPEGDIKIIQPLDTGVVSSILCREGDFVKKGQALMEIDPSMTAPEVESKKKNLQFLELEKLRMYSAPGNKGFNPDAKIHDKETIKIQKELYASSIASVEKQLDGKKAELNRIEEEIESTQKDKSYNSAMLAAASEKEKRLRAVIDIIARNEYEKAANDILTYSNNIEQSRHKIEQLNHQKAQIASETALINENFKAASLKEFSDKHRQTTEIKAEIDKTAFRNEKQRILSPVEGHVSNLYFHTIGGVVTPAQKLMAIVPVDAPLIIKALVLNKDIGFVKNNMPVLIKIDTFDFQKYGTLKGVIRNIAKHSIDDEKLGPVYEVFINFLESRLMVEGQMVPVTSGMSLTGEIRVGERRIIEFFIYPLIKYLDEGIKVR
ncbi:MAG: HlyD family type I secretion periplasmic adaptor subunit [Proteobacteria bacterium]|nr:HlyD family type I secretion periplasmic adaptor subunit [Pseudomonadota bacterium]